MSPALTDLASRLSDRFETRVKVDLGQKKGKIVVEFASIDDLERILGTLAPGEGRVLEKGLGEELRRGRRGLSASAAVRGRAVFRFVPERGPPFAVWRYPRPCWVDTMRSGMAHPP